MTAGNWKTLREPVTLSEGPWLQATEAELPLPRSGGPGQPQKDPEQLEPTVPLCTRQAPGEG